MDNLRILLMVLGIIIIAGIYLWGVGFDTRKASNKLNKRRNKKREEPLLDTPVIKPREEEIDYSNVFKQESLAFDNDVIAGDSGLSNSGQATISTDSVKKSGVVVLYVTAPAGYSFSGDMIRDALYAAGMNFGDMNIFHHYGVGQSTKKESIFSVANMHEPGTFDLNYMDECQTDGLVLFLELPAPIDAAVAFEHMLSTAQRLADVLKGHTRDERREYLTFEGIELLRSYVAGFNG